MAAHVSQESFKQRFTALVVGGRGYPKKQADRQIVLISATLKLRPDHDYSELAINEQLRDWTAEFGAALQLDHVTLRRFLVDERFLIRDPAGRHYGLNTESPPCTFDQGIYKLNLLDLVAEARAERERRKQIYLNRSDN